MSGVDLLSVLDAEIARIEAMGVEMVLNRTVHDLALDVYSDQDLNKSVKCAVLDTLRPSRIA